MELPDNIKKHPVYVAISIIAASCGLTWYLANELLVKPKDLTIEQKNASIETLKNRIDGKVTTSTSTGTVQTKEAFELSVKESKYLEDLLMSVASSRSGLSVTLRNSAEYRVWLKNLLGMVRDIFSDRQGDVYAVWLRPTLNKPDKLTVYAENGLSVAYKHVGFCLNEGLAGKVWATGIPASTSTLKKHPWWVYREGCTNQSYICVPVGEKGGKGGIISVGSNNGFEIKERDQDCVKIFAAILSIAASSEPH